MILYSLLEQSSHIIGLRQVQRHQYIRIFGRGIRSLAQEQLDQFLASPPPGEMQWRIAHCISYLYARTVANKDLGISHRHIRVEHGVCLTRLVVVAVQHAVQGRHARIN